MTVDEETGMEESTNKRYGMARRVVRISRPAVHALLMAAALCAGNAVAQQYPNKPIRLIVPVPAGGGADFVARTYAGRLTETLGQQVVVDNRGGAAGIIAMDAVAKAAPDGYTLVQTNISTVSINPYIYAKLPYDAQKDFAPVSLVTWNPMFLVVHPSVPARTAKELIAYGRERPGLTYASLGGGSIQHLAGYLFGKEAGIEVVHVPYKGAAPATVDLLAGQVNMAFSGIGTVASLLKAGKLRALAVSSNKRIESFPEVPTMKESGGPAIEMSIWNGVLAPARTPAAVVNRLAAEIGKAAKSPELLAALSTQGTSPTANTPEEFTTFIRREQAHFQRLVKEIGVRAD